MAIRLADLGAIQLHTSTWFLVMGHQKNIPSDGTCPCKKEWALDQKKNGSCLSREIVSKNGGDKQNNNEPTVK